MKKLFLSLLALVAMVVTANAQRAWAYDLGLEYKAEDYTYTFTFNATTAANATLILYSDGAEAGAIDLGAVTAGKNTFTLTIPQLQESTASLGEFTWGVKMTGAAIALASNGFTAEVTDNSRGIYNFYLPQDVIVDNNPESNHFGQIYVAAATDGASDGSTTRADNQKRGVFVYNQKLDELNPTTNVGILPNNVNLAITTRHAMHRMAINPVDNHVAFAYNVSGASAVWCMDPANLSGEATDLIAGLGITKANSICFDEDGVLYVMDNGNTSTGGTLVKVENGALTKIVQSAIWGVEDNAIVSDGRGGIWIAQNRSAIDVYAVLSHVNANGEIDFKVTSASETALQNLFPKANGNTSYRGQCAYYVKDDLLAFGGNYRGTVYKVTYDATTGVPSLSTLYKTPYLGQNIDGLAFDYAGDLYLVSATKERLYKYAIPTNNNTCTVPAKKAQVISIESSLPAYTITATPNNDAMGTIAGSGKYVEGATATLTATPAEHHDFVSWTGDITSTDNPLTITVNSDMTITANFQEHAKYTITASAADNTMGYVTGGGTYYVGETVTLKATAKTGYYFTGWSDSNTDNPRTITVAEDVTLQANFAVAHPRVYAYALDVTDNGDSYTFSFKPNTDAVGGNLLLYNEDRTDVVQTHAITSSLVAHTAATITLNKSDLPNQTNIPWAIELSGNAIPVFAETFADADYRFAKGHATVDNSPESEYFGRVYVADRRSTKANSGLYVYNPDFTQVNADAYKLGMATAGYSRPAVGADGTVYLTGYTDAESGIFVVNPADLTTCTQFYNGTRASNGLFTNGDVEIGSSTSGVGVYGVGKDAVLYSMMEDGTNANANSGKQPIVKYQIGQEDGTVLKQWSTAPTWHINYPATGTDSYNFGNNAFAATEKGVWISQNKSNDADRPEIAFIDKDGEIQFMQNLNKSQGAGLAVNADNTTLYLQKAGEILEYTISWTGNKPALTLAKTYPVSLPYITTLSLDYAGNLIACAGTQYGSNTNNNVMKLVCYTLPTDNNTCTTPAPKALVITKPSNPTVLDNTTVAPQVQKIIRDGQVLIIRDGKTFNMMGQEVR